ncbi:hypothetical protein IV203_031329 [Nitzschia inconspicua]|uniref:NADH dehydrogenase [ubiquinone] 1 alpha subcomplex subunit 1 n=1 Tax=Nitzschia inconspicua TaxID=303405 RepID=A0A9K3KQX9_9STRA|nr:hypothetical protein IV203_016621 [Nitzschia inconspicua]KAG7368586.1 hypothetical protein IV203_031329 [Nitzschia inconspicua]
MPWQSLSSLFVVMTMFNVTPLLVSGIHYIGYGKKKELGLPSNEWNYRMEKRDEMYKRIEKEVRKSMK